MSLKLKLYFYFKMVDVDPVSGDVIVVAVVLIQVEHLLKEINFLKMFSKSILWQPDLHSLVHFCISFTLHYIVHLSINFIKRRNLHELYTLNFVQCTLSTVYTLNSFSDSEGLNKSSILIYVLWWGGGVE